jgi:CheY-like chemotaxis protein
VVLVVDPHEDSRLMLRCWLQDCCGFLVQDVGSVGEAIRIVAASVPDVITTEMAFPGADGYEFCRRIRQDARTSGVRLIALTASVMRPQVERAYHAGCDMVLPKPCLPATLLDAIRGLLPPLQRVA